jgi:hypothetical protein
MPLIYSFVARDDKTILAEYSPYRGNFNTVALECLQHLQPGVLLLAPVAPTPKALHAVL